MDQNKIALVFGNSLASSVGGYTWIKHNICKALVNNGYTVLSVAMVVGQKKMMGPENVVSIVERDKSTQFVIDEINILDREEWSALVNAYSPSLVVAVGDPDHIWFTPIEIKCRSIAYFLTEAPTVNKYIPVNVASRKNMYLDISQVLAQFTTIIPGTPMTSFGIINDLDVPKEKISDHIFPPVTRWNVSVEKARKYREDIGVDGKCKLFFTICVNNERKRLDQLLVYFKNVILKNGKPCYKLVIHTNNSKDGYELKSIIKRLCLQENVITNHKTGYHAIEGIFSAGTCFISTPAAEGYGLPFHEALLLGIPCIHSSVGYPAITTKEVKSQDIKLIDATTPYFYRIGNQVWYSISSESKTIQYGKTGNYNIEDLVIDDKEFRSRFMKVVNE